MKKIWCNNCGREITECSCTMGRLTDQKKLEKFRKDIINLKGILLDKVTKPLKCIYGEEGHPDEKEQRRNECRVLRVQLNEKFLELDLIRRSIELEKKIKKSKKSNEPKIYHIVIEGHEEEEVRALWEEIQNQHELYDNCIFEECNAEDTIMDKDRFKKTGRLEINEEIVKKFGDE